MNQRIPLLSEVLSLCTGKIKVNIEIKAQNMVEKVLSLLREFEMEQDIIISSFIHPELLKFHEYAPNICTATLEPTTSSFSAMIRALVTKKRYIDQMNALHASGIHPHFALVNRRLIEETHKMGKFVNVWTVDSPKMWTRLREFKVDGIVTNNPEALYHFFHSKTH